jgi:hypothetical protein|tara:strand:+ start:176 stop:475 length:300 start_codon:yes stop_codon:yes gene_type:complete
MTTTFRVAQVAGGGGGNGIFLDIASSVTVSDTRIRSYVYAVTAASEIVVGDQKGPVIKQPVLAANTGDDVYIGDDGIRCDGNVSVAGMSNAGKIYLYYG